MEDWNKIIWKYYKVWAIFQCSKYLKWLTTRRKYSWTALHYIPYFYNKKLVEFFTPIILYLHEPEGHHSIRPEETPYYLIKILLHRLFLQMSVCLVCKFQISAFSKKSISPNPHRHLKIFYKGQWVNVLLSGTGPNVILFPTSFTLVLEYMESRGDGRTADADETLRIRPLRFSAILGNKRSVIPVTDSILQCINLVQKAPASGR